MTKGEELAQPQPDDAGSGSDSEDDLVLQEIHNSTELADHDRQVLLDEEEREEFLTRKRSEGHRSFFAKEKNKHRHGHDQGKTPQRPHRSRRRKHHNGATDEAGELLYEMEEGGAKDDESSQASSSSAELDNLQLGRSETAKVCPVDDQLKNPADFRTSETEACAPSWTGIRHSTLLPPPNLWDI